MDESQNLGASVVGSITSIPLAFLLLHYNMIISRESAEDDMG